jgi:YegS/Rv2252/BmrU family lipid kinase
MTSKRLSVIVNPCSGRGRGLQILDRVRPVLERAGFDLDVFVTKFSGHASEIAQSMQLEDCAGCCVIGGDGTVHEVIDGLMRRSDGARVPVGLIPGGSANTIHQHMGCLDPSEAAKAIANGVTCGLDIAQVTMGSEVVYAFDIVGWGVASDINRMAEKLRWIGSSRYAVASLLAIIWSRPRRAKITLEGKPIEGEFLLVLGCNTKFAGHRLRMCPLAEISDGKMDVVVLRPTSSRQLLSVFTKVFYGSHLSLKCLEYHQVQSFAIDGPGRETLDIDGEIKGTVPMHVQMIPSALHVFSR